MQLQEGFLSHVSHELRTPLTSIHEFTTILLDGLAGEINPEAQEYLDIILRNAEQLKRMIGDLLTLTRSGSGKLAVEPAFISFAELINQALRSLETAATSSDVSLSAEVAADLPTVYADPARIYEVLTNLIDNAIKYTPRGGRVVVRADVWKDQPKFVRLSVSDTGRGISPEHAKRVFERFYQVPKDVELSRNGLGLGLYISQELVRAHGGAVGLESELGRGTTVSFTLPIFSPAPLILPLLSAQNLQKGCLALITIRLPRVKGLSAEDELRYSRVANEVLKRCIRSGDDVLLPGLHARASTGTFHVLACADPGEAEAIVNRVKQDLSQLQGSALPAEAVEAFSTTVAMPRTKTSPPLHIANQLADQIEALVEAEEISAAG